MKILKAGNASARWATSVMVFIGLQMMVTVETARAAELIWTGDFETGDFSQFQTKLSNEGGGSTKKMVTSPVRAGKYATELVIRDVSANSSQRAELMTQLEGSGGRVKFAWDGPEYWLGFSFLFKEAPAISYTFFQLHAPNEPNGDPCDYAGNTFSVWGGGAGANGGYVKDVVVRIIEDGGVSTGKGAASNNRVVHSYDLPLNKWQDYVVNFKLSTQGKGFYKVWKNGVLIYSKSGLTNVNYRDSCGNLIPKDQRRHSGAHLGLYAPSTSGYRRIYYDEVRVAQGSDGYKLVSPDQSAAPTVPKDDPESPPKPPVIAGN